MSKWLQFYHWIVNKTMFYGIAYNLHVSILLIKVKYRNLSLNKTNINIIVDKTLKNMVNILPYLCNMKIFVFYIKIW